MEKTKKLTFAALLTGLALLLFMVEAQIPSFTSIPGIKLGLSNIVTLLAIRLIDKKSAAAILAVRIVLGSIFTGQVVSFMYSLAGGTLCWVAMCLIDRVISDKQVWAMSITGAIFHNIGQIGVAMLIMANFRLIWYLPYLLISAVVSGLFTGICAQLLISCYRKYNFLK